MKARLVSLLAIVLSLVSCTQSQDTQPEKIFAGYFDILTNSPAGSEVTGRIHLERNKDVLSRPIPEGYRFEIVKQPAEKLFRLDTRYDLSERIMGVLSVEEGKQTGSEPSVYSMTIALMDGDKLLQQVDIDVRIVEETLWSLLYKRYTPQTLNNKRMYGRIKYTDDEVADLMNKLEQNGWKFPGLEKCYEGRPQDYTFIYNPENDHHPAGTIEYDWVKVVKQIGGLGYSYATSKVYGPDGVPEKREALRNVLYKALLTYVNSVPVNGNEVLVDGKPIGNCIGDGFGLLQKHRMAGMQITTHQWELTDGLMVPVLHLMPDILKGIKQGNQTCIELHNSLIDYLQLFFAEIESRRAIDNPNGRWGELQDTIYSAGAWGDANLGHRSRTLLALPIIWADYNRPLTYVPYWYTDYYHDKPFKGFSYSTGWSPHGVVADVSRWMTQYNIVAHRYIQSGFQPDGTVSHHTDNGTDAVMVAYGFEWLTDCNMGYQYFKGTDFEIPGKYMQFQLDRLLDVYPHLFYKQRMDFLVAGRSFLDDMKHFVLKTYPDAVTALQKAQSEREPLKGMDELNAVVEQLKNNTYEYSGTTAYWVNEYLVHRRGGEDEKPFYASLKLKSWRTVGAEDFDKVVRHSWHMGYGILPLKVSGDEYAENVLQNYDWHALPGLTEEWRTDSLPIAGGVSQASLPGANDISGVLSDGEAGMGIYHHLTKETYSSATAFKSYHFIGDNVMAQGSGVARQREGQQKEIVTFVDQSAFNQPLTWCVGGRTEVAQPGKTLDLALTVETPCWLHHADKGYLILPVRRTQLLIKTGQSVNTTDRRIADGKPNYIIALNHGVTPCQAWEDNYRYILVPNVSAEEMPARVASLLKEIQFEQQTGKAHATYSAPDKTWQFAFFKPGKINVGGMEVLSNDTAQIMLRDSGDHWVLSVQNPVPDGKKQTLSFRLSQSLPEGVYTYRTQGVYPMEGETVTVKPDGEGSWVEVQLPDSRDAKHYNYQSDLYAAVPIVINIAK